MKIERVKETFEIIIDRYPYYQSLNEKLLEDQIMLFSLLTSFIENYSFLNVFKYLTFRTGLSVITSLIVVFLMLACSLETWQ